MSRFSKALKRYDGRLKHLPVLHSCDGYGFRGILETRSINVSYCKVFEEERLYTYYGIPSYRKSLGEAARDKVWFPICFILNLDFLPSFCKIYPFDSGGFELNKEKREKYFHGRMEVSDFELEKDIADAVRVIQAFYGNNEGYIKGRPAVDPEAFFDIDFEAKGYASLVSNESRSYYDSRMATIEVVFSEAICLNDQSLIQVIVPESFLDNQFVVCELLDRYGIDNPLSYYTIMGNPVEYFGAIYNEYMRFVVSNDLI